MIRYVAFLRAINVAGQKLIKMKELARIFESMGFKNVRTYIQSGNVIFDASSANSAALIRKIQTRLNDALGYDVTVILRSAYEIEKLVRRNPFKKIKPGDDVILFVVFLADEPRNKPKLPLISTTEKLEVFEIKDRTAFVLSRRKKNGWFGFPNAFVEKQLGMLGTTRNWSTVRKLMDFAHALESTVEKKKR